MRADSALCFIGITHAECSLAAMPRQVMRYALDGTRSDLRGGDGSVALNRMRRSLDIPSDREVDDMRWTGRTEVDLAILSYDERLMASTRPAGVRHPWTPCVRVQGRSWSTSEGRRFLTVRKAIDVRV